MTADETVVHFYISPHLDDAVFSCGGRIWRQTEAGEQVAVITVFGRAPEEGSLLSPYAQELHDRWGHPVEAARQRREEDVEALALVGAEPVHWPYLDCVYRRTSEGGFPYVSEGALWGPIHTSDLRLIQELAQRIAALRPGPCARLYSPLGAGGHVDHRIVRQAAEASGHELVHYEDFPYARDPQALDAALEGGRWTAELVPLSERALQARVDAIACYRSQLSTFWGGRDEMSAAVREYAALAGGGKPTERYWRLAGD